MPRFHAGLVLEGGGYKGMFTAGVLDFFLEKNMEFTSAYGVSAGACALCSYISKQPHRAFETFVDYAGMKQFCSSRSFLLTGDLFNADMSYDLIPNYLNPYDYDKAMQYPGKAYAVCTDIESGKPEYFLLKDLHETMSAIRASASMPLVSQNVRIGDRLYLDGGMSDAIPIRKSVQDGNQKSIVVLTKKKDYRRKAASPMVMAMVRTRYRRYPQLIERFENWPGEYNQTLRLLDEMEKKGEILILRPSNLYGIGRVDKDRERLQALYEEGWKTAADHYEQIMSFLIKSEENVNA